MQTDLFSVVNVEGPSVEKLEADALACIGRIFDEGYVCVVLFSSGKDSSSVANLTLTAAKLAVDRGLSPLVVVSTGDTLVENPEIAMHYRQEQAKMVAFGKKHGFRVITRVSTPYVSSTFQFKILTGRGLPSYAGGQGDCTVDLKVAPQKRDRKLLFKQLKKEGYGPAVTLLGTRFDESTRRAANMTSRGERSDRPVLNKDDELVLSPICHWSTDDVWEYLGLAGSGIILSYSNFAETRRIYSASMGTSCVIVADALLEGGKKQKLGKCGARTGCFTCLQTEDKSLKNMVEMEPRYAYARGLIRLNNYLRAIRYDWSKRHWVGRTIRAGYVAIQPDTFHPGTIRELTRMMLQLDFDEQERADAAGERPMFCILPVDMLIAIDAAQSLNGVARPFSCWADWRDIHDRGIRYDIPEIPETPQQELPAARFFYTGEGFTAGERNPVWSGVRDAYTEALTADSACAQPLRELDNGNMTWDAETELAMNVDAESAGMILEFEFERLAQMHDQGFSAGSSTWGYQWYRQYGALALSHTQVKEHDEICRRTQWKDRNGMTLDYSVPDLLSRSISFTELPPAAAKAWSHKSTMSTAQFGMFETGSSNDEDFEEVEEIAA
jgi:3'-phosphoadenosine 5'-phosphosulfate sulfotransferase (PAPS reductase)/FAD synthetase